MLNYSSVKLTPRIDFLKKPYTFDLITKIFFIFPKCFVVANKLNVETLPQADCFTFIYVCFFTL